MLDLHRDQFSSLEDYLGKVWECLSCSEGQRFPKGPHLGLKRWSTACVILEKNGNFFLKKIKLTIQCHHADNVNQTLITRNVILSFCDLDFL